MTTAWLSQADILEAIKMLLRERGELPSDCYGYFRYRFGMVGDPMITLVGDSVAMPNAGDLYLDWGFEPLQNVSALPTRKKE